MGDQRGKIDHPVVHELKHHPDVPANRVLNIGRRIVISCLIVSIPITWARLGSTEQLDISHVGSHENGELRPTRKDDSPMRNAVGSATHNGLSFSMSVNRLQSLEPTFRKEGISILGRAFAALQSLFHSYFTEKTLLVDPTCEPHRSLGTVGTVGMEKRKTPKNAPGRTRTCDPRIRNPLLYPAELRALFFGPKNGCLRPRSTRSAVLKVRSS